MDCFAQFLDYERVGVVGGGVLVELLVDREFWFWWERGVVGPIAPLVVFKVVGCGICLSVRRASRAVRSAALAEIWCGALFVDS